MSPKRRLSGVRLPAAGCSPSLLMFCQRHTKQIGVTPGGQTGSQNPEAAGPGPSPVDTLGPRPGTPPSKTSPTGPIPVCPTLSPRTPQGTPRDEAPGRSTGLQLPSDPKCSQPCSEKGGRCAHSSEYLSCSSVLKKRLIFTEGWLQRDLAELNGNSTQWRNKTRNCSLGRVTTEATHF